MTSEPGSRHRLALSDPSSADPLSLGVSLGVTGSVLVVLGVSLGSSDGVVDGSAGVEAGLVPGSEEVLGVSDDDGVVGVPAGEVGLSEDRGAVADVESAGSDDWDGPGVGVGPDVGPAVPGWPGVTGEDSPGALVLLAAPDDPLALADELVEPDDELVSVELAEDDADEPALELDGLIDELLDTQPVWQGTGPSWSRPLVPRQPHCTSLPSATART